METNGQEYWEAPSTHFPQEPIFVPRPEATAEDDGILLVGGFNSETAKGRFIQINTAQLLVRTSLIFSTSEFNQIHHP